MSKETELLPCPFCGSGLYAQWNRANPKARCETVGCMGAKLPILNLDQPDDIAAWNRRDLRQGDAQAALAARDAERLDWLDQNIFSRENINFMGQLDPTMNMWVTFSPKGHQGSARNILDAAMQAQAVQPTNIT